MNRRVRTIALTLALAGTGYVFGCSSKDEGPTGPVGGPGALSVVLSTSSTAGGAIQFTITGTGITNPQAASGYTIYTRSSGNNLNVAVVGDLASGSLMTFNVPNTNGSYSASVVAAAGTDNALLAANQFSLGVN